jgi:SAM-dependent methyltransferase
LDAWVSEQGRRLTGLVLNVGAGEDARQFGARTVRLDAFAPAPSIRADVNERLPFSDAIFDGAVCSEVLEHVRDPRMVLAEIRRVLKPGASTIVTVPFYFHYHGDPDDYSRLTPHGLRVELERAGFEVDLVAGVGGKMIAALMLLDSMHLIVRILLRSALVPFHGALGRRPIVNGRWSDSASHVVAVARARPDADR